MLRHNTCDTPPPLAVLRPYGLEAGTRNSKSTSDSLWVGKNWNGFYCKRNNILFSLFIKTHLVMQESIILSKSLILHNIALWPQMLYNWAFKKMDYFSVHSHIVHIVEIHKNEWTIVLKKYVLTIPMKCSKILITYKSWNSCRSCHSSTIDYLYYMTKWTHKNGRAVNITIIVWR